jgi:hypothetical protein
MTDWARVPAVATSTALIRCGADLVELAEGLWLRLFRTGLIAVVLAGPLSLGLAVADAESVRDGVTAGVGALVSALAVLARSRALPRSTERSGVRAWASSHRDSSARRS